MEAATTPGTDLRSPGGGSQSPVKSPGEEAIETLGKDRVKPPTPEVAIDALEWFLSEEDEGAPVTHTIEINMGTATSQKWVPWVIQPIDDTELRRIQQSGTNRAQRRRGGGADPDMSEVNRRIVVAGTVSPDLLAVAQTKGVADPAIALRHRFRHKPGIVDQIAGEILALSGYEEDVIRDAKEVKAAGNS